MSANIEKSEFGWVWVSVFFPQVDLQGMIEPNQLISGPQSGVQGPNDITAELI